MALQRCGIWICIKPLARCGQLEKIGTMWGGWFIVAKPSANMFLTGFMSNVDMTSSVLALGLPAFFRKHWYWGIPLVLLALFRINILGGLIPACIVTCAFLWFKYRKTRLFIIGFAIISMWAVMPNIISEFTADNPDSRIKVWEFLATKIFTKKYIVGWGVGQFKILMPAIQKAINYSPVQLFKQAHNEYLQCAIEQGSIGILIVLGFIIHTILRAWKIRTEIMFIGLMGVFTGLFNSGVNFLFHTTTVILFLMYLAIMEKEIIYNKVNNKRGIGV